MSELHSYPVGLKVILPMLKDSTFKTSSNEESTGGTIRTLIQRQLCIPASCRIVYVGRVWKWISLLVTIYTLISMCSSMSRLFDRNHKRSQFQVFQNHIFSRCQRLIYMSSFWRYYEPCHILERRQQWCTSCVEYLIKVPTLFHVAILVTLKAGFHMIANDRRRSQTIAKRAVSI